MLAHQVIKTGIDYHGTLGASVKSILCQNSTLLHAVQAAIQATTGQPLNMADLPPIQIAYKLFDAFKPKQDPYQNLCYHIETECQMKVLQQLAEEDEEYMNVYRKMCLVRYGGYLPNSYRNVQSKVNEYRQQYDEIKAKRFVYRGYDNLKMVKNFY